MSDDVATSPIGEPLVFRLTGYQGSHTNNDSRYSVVWKLNRDPVAKLTAAQLDELGVAGNRGSYAAAGYELAEFGGVSAGRKPGCLGGDVGVDDTPQVGRLDRVPLGGGVKIELWPLTPAKAPPGWKLGRKYVFNVKMRTADHLKRSDAAKRQLATIGC